MEQRLALPALAAFAVSSLFGSLTLPAAADVAKPGTIVSIAGTGAPGYAGDNGPATQALLNQPFDLALDAAGNLYISDARNARVRKVSPDGTITTVAGTGQPGFSGDNGKATDAQLKLLVGVVVDGAGNLFIADGYNHRVRKVTPDGTITTVAGTGTAGFTGDGGKATDARLNQPTELAVDSAGNLYITEFNGSHRVRKVDAVTGIITTVAGNGHPTYSGDNGPATAAGMDPGGPAVDSAGNLFFNDNYRVRKVDAVTGIVTTVAGNGKNQPYSGDGGLATETGLRGVGGLTIDAAGNLLFSEFPFPHVAPYDDRVLKVYGVAAPGLIAGMRFPVPKQP